MARLRPEALYDNEPDRDPVDAWDYVAQRLGRADAYRRRIRNVALLTFAGGVGVGATVAGVIWWLWG